jgi:hypothetical protein
MGRALLHAVYHAYPVASQGIGFGPMAAIDSVLGIVVRRGNPINAGLCEAAWERSEVCHE